MTLRTLAEAAEAKAQEREAERLARLAAQEEVESEKLAAAARSIATEAAVVSAACACMALEPTRTSLHGLLPHHHDDRVAGVRAEGATQR